MSLRLDNELAPAEVMALDAHLDACGDCREVWGAMLELSTLFAEARMMVPPEGFTDQVMVLLAKHRAARWSVWGALLLFLGGAVVALLMVLPFLGTAGVLVEALRQPSLVRHSMELLPGFFSVGQALLRAVWLLLSSVMRFIPLPLLVVYLWSVLMLTAVWLLVLRAARPSTDALARNL
jgi:predicted anti-sigma-YlaC factor YlaD